MLFSLSIYLNLLTSYAQAGNVERGISSLVKRLQIAKLNLDNIQNPRKLSMILNEAFFYL